MNLGKPCKDMVWVWVEYRIGGRFGARVLGRVWDRACERIGGSVRARVWARVSDRVQARVRAMVWEGIEK